MLLTVSPFALTNDSLGTVFHRQGGMCTEAQPLTLWRGQQRRCPLWPFPQSRQEEPGLKHEGTEEGGSRPGLQALLSGTGLEKPGDGEEDFGLVLLLTPGTEFLNLPLNKGECGIFIKPLCFLQISHKTST